MKEIKFKGLCGEEGKNYFNPYTAKNNGSNSPGVKMFCVCGYELIKESENTYKCTGGNHRYIIQDGDIILDKYGNILLKIPENKPK